MNLGAYGFVVEERCITFGGVFYLIRNVAGAPAVEIRVCGYRCWGPSSECVCNE